LKRQTQFAIVLVLAALAAVPALAQNSRVYRDGNGWVEEISGSLPQARVLKVATDIGSIQVNGSGDSEIKYVIKKHSYNSSEDSARRSLQQFEVSASKRGDAAVIEGSWNEGHAHRFNVDINLTVPHGMQVVKLASDGGNINVAGLSGKLEAETGGGEIHLDEIGDASAETGGGTINVGRASGELTVKTGGGNIRVTSAGGNLNAESGGGSIWIGNAGNTEIDTGGGAVHVDSCSGGAKVSTGGGAIELGDINGSVSMETGGGSIHLSSAKGPVHVETGGGSLELWKLYNGVRAETGAGSITAELAGTPHGSSSMETSAGDLTLYIDSDVKVTIDAEIEQAYGHHINSDFPELKISTEGGENWGPKTVTATGNLNGGGAVIKLSCNIGNINIRRGKR
jgi:DUF4097 and DUF4098 domain-containing protein YvlB